MNEKEKALRATEAMKALKKREEEEEYEKINKSIGIYGHTYIGNARVTRRRQKRVTQDK